MASTSKASGDKPAAGKSGKPQRRKVRATKTGYYEHTIRNVGDVFIQDDAISPFSDKWMEPVDESVPEKVTGSNAVIEQEHDRILRERTGGATGDTPTGDQDVIS